MTESIVPVVDDAGQVLLDHDEFPRPQTTAEGLASLKPSFAAIADMPEEALREHLATLQAAEFVYEASLFPDLEYTFKHALTHEVTYGGLVQGRRRALHARIVDAIETLHGLIETGELLKRRNATGAGASVHVEAAPVPAQPVPVVLGAR